VHFQGVNQLSRNDPGNGSWSHKLKGKMNW
jgi:hypothetical protein